MKIPHRIKKMRSNIVHIGNRIDELEGKRQVKIEEIQNLCHHEFISEFNPKGILNHGQRICEVCCLEEYSKSGYMLLHNRRNIKKITQSQVYYLREMKTNI